MLNMKLSILYFCICIKYRAIQIFESRAVPTGREYGQTDAERLVVAFGSSLKT